MDFKERKKLAIDERASADQALRIKVDSPACLSNIQKKKQQLYTPVPQKFFGYSQMPRQTCLPYQNNTDYQKLLKRHMNKGQVLQTFDFPPNQGRQLKQKTESTEQTIAEYALSPENKRYGKRVSLRLTKPD